MKIKNMINEIRIILKSLNLVILCNLLLILGVVIGNVMDWIGEITIFFAFNAGVIYQRWWDKKKSLEQSHQGKEHQLTYRFRRYYANIPLKLRDEIICVINQNPLTIENVRAEIDDKTKVGYEAVAQLTRLKII